MTFSHHAEVTRIWLEFCQALSTSLSGQTWPDSPPFIKTCSSKNNPLFPKYAPLLFSSLELPCFSNPFFRLLCQLLIPFATLLPTLQSRLWHISFVLCHLHTPLNELGRFAEVSVCHTRLAYSPPGTNTLPQLLGSTGLGSWMCNSATFLTGSLSPSHFLWGCLKGCARGGRAERCQEEQAGGKSSSVPLAARSVSSNSFKPKWANASNPKVHSYPANSHFVKVFCFLALLQFLSVPLPVQDSCPPQIFAVQWKKAVSGLLKLASINKIKVHNFLAQLVRSNFWYA